MDDDLRARASRLRMRRVAATDPAAVAAVERYYDELRALFPDGFDPGPAALDAGAFVLAVEERDGVSVVVACGGLQPLPHLGSDVAELKRMWVDPQWRGAGVGRRMLAHLEEVAASLGHRRAVLDTSDLLLGAIALYERSGWTRVPAYNDNPYARLWFEKTLTPRG